MALFDSLRKVRSLDSESSPKCGTASRHFSVPSWRFTRGAPIDSDHDAYIVKPLTADFVGDYKLMFTTRTAPSELDPAYPWLLQKEVIASHDVTVVYVSGQCFGLAWIERHSQESIGASTSTQTNCLEAVEPVSVR